MKSTSFVLVVMFALLSASLYAQFEKTETLKVYGNCGMCEEKIEHAGNIKKVSAVAWDKDSKIATLTYNSEKTSKDEILKRIALAGYDNELYYAPDDVYEKLPGCCHYDRAKEKTATTTHHTEVQSSMSDQDQESSPLKQVAENYIELKDALVQSNGELASKKANALLNELTKVKMESLKGETHNAWMKVKSQLIEDAEHIGETKDVSHQRDHFNSLSQSLHTLLKAAPTGITLYYQHCPMYNDGKGGDWLSKESAIKNPFYGSQMLSCGKTVETLK